MKDDLYYFEQAIMLARCAFANGFSPVGAIVVANNGESERLFGRNSQRKIGNTYHAEFLAMGDYQSGIRSMDSNSLTLYSTLEPCLMCLGMAAVLRVDRIKWLVDDIWAGTRTLNYNNPYVQKRVPTLDKANNSPFHQEALEMWVKYLRATGHADAVSFMLGLPEDYELQGSVVPYFAQNEAR